MRLLDIGSGPGELLDLTHSNVIKIGIDPEIRMLQQASNNFIGIRGVGEKLPIRSASIDRVVSAFVLRNLRDRESVFDEITRVLVNGGKGALIDFSPPGTRMLGYPVYIYIKYILPLIGGILASDFEAYKYLSRTILAFPQPEVIRLELINANLKNVRARRLMGGVTVLYTFESHIDV